jgi:hypothetical protein
VGSGVADGESARVGTAETSRENLGPAGFELGDGEARELIETHAAAKVWPRRKAKRFRDLVIDHIHVAAAELRGMQ